MFWVEKKVCLKLSRHKHATRYVDSAARLVISSRPELLPSKKKSASINVSIEEKSDNKSCTIGCSQKPLIRHQVGKVCRTAMQLQDINTSRGLARPNELKATERRNATLCFVYMSANVCWPCGYSPAVPYYSASKQGQRRGRLRLRAAYCWKVCGWKVEIKGDCSLWAQRERSLFWSSFPLLQPFSLHHEVNLIYQLCSEQPETCVDATYPTLVRVRHVLWLTREHVLHGGERNRLTFGKTNTLWCFCRCSLPCKNRAYPLESLECRQQNFYFGNALEFPRPLCSFSAPIGP